MNRRMKATSSRISHDRFLCPAPPLPSIPPAVPEQTGAPRAPLPAFAGGDTSATDLEREIAAPDADTDPLRWFISFTA
jgi:hypothetical protein